MKKNVLINCSNHPSDKWTAEQKDGFFIYNNLMDEKRNYWKEEEELLLKEWADKAQCYELLHHKAGFS